MELLLFVNFDFIANLLTFNDHSTKRYSTLFWLFLIFVQFNSCLCSTFEENDENTLRKQRKMDKKIT